MSLNKAARDITGIKYYPRTICGDNNAEAKNTQKEGCHKLCDFYEDVPTVEINLRNREQTGVIPALSVNHGDFIKQELLRKAIKVQ